MYADGERNKNVYLFACKVVVFLLFQMVWLVHRIEYNIYLFWEPLFLNIQGSDNDKNREFPYVYFSHPNLNLIFSMEAQKSWSNQKSLSIFHQIMYIKHFPTFLIITSLFPGFLIATEYLRFQNGQISVQGGWCAGCNPPSVLDGIRLNGLPAPPTASHRRLFALSPRRSAVSTFPPPPYSVT